MHPESNQRLYANAIDAAAKHATYKRDCEVQSEPYHGSAGSVGYAAKPREMSGLEGVIQDNFNRLAELGDAIVRLGNKLEPVLCPEQPTPTTANDSKLQAVQAQSVAVMQLQAQRASLEALISRVNAIAHRFD
jgi:hypothetical protein